MTTKDLTKKKMPLFLLERCKRCGICSHFCPTEAISVDQDGTPVLAHAEACNSCGLCEGMCPDWAVYLSLVDLEQGDGKTN
jgi:2-oxoglutarate ferredoxin oxidoreductase subunit delta